MKINVWGVLLAIAICSVWFVILEISYRRVGDYCIGRMTRKFLKGCRAVLIYSTSGEQMRVTKTKTTFKDLRIGMPVKVVSEVVDFTFFHGQEGVIEKLADRYLGVGVIFKEPIKYQDGTELKRWNFNPENLKILGDSIIKECPTCGKPLGV